MQKNKLTLLAIVCIVAIVCITLVTINTVPSPVTIDNTETAKLPDNTVGLAVEEYASSGLIDGIIKD